MNWVPALLAAPLLLVGHGPHQVLGGDVREKLAPTHNSLDN